MLNKKGVAMPIIGTILVVATIILIYSLTQAVETKQRTIMLKGELSISGQNQAEITKRFAEVSFKSIAKKAVEHTSPIDCSDKERTAALLKSNLITILPGGVDEISSEREIQWLAPEIDISPTALGASVTGVHIIGNQTFVFENKKIDMRIYKTVYYDEIIESNIFVC